MGNYTEKYKNCDQCINAFTNDITKWDKWTAIYYCKKVHHLCMKRKNPVDPLEGKCKLCKEFQKKEGADERTAIMTCQFKHNACKNEKLPAEKPYVHDSQWD